MIAYPKIIELFGLPRTGKTTTAHALYKYYTDKGKKTHLIKERASVCPVKDKLSPLFNLWTTSAYLKEYVEETENKCSIIISDRGIIDASIWIASFNTDGVYSKEYEAVMGLLDYDLIRQSVLLAAYFTADIEVVLDREYKGLVGMRNGRILNEETLIRYIHSYHNLYNRFPAPIEEIDTTRITQKETIDILIKRLDVIENGSGIF
ncbi:MAG: hypothetical protein LGR52_07670 [Candidatus Thiosymbion ectosymbiont of Robbea hypermnestra]|nr:hypothetical protein [Candidatus Thiosymbion ectosymbiont of Robbea hypermnestra]